MASSASIFDRAARIATIRSRRRDVATPAVLFFFFFFLSLFFVYLGLFFFFFFLSFLFCRFLVSYGFLRGGFLSRLSTA